MTVTFPDWYDGGYPDAELLVMDLLQPFLNLLAPAVEAVTWLPDDYGDRLPIVRIYRTGGAIDFETRTDHAAVQLGVIGADRSESWAIAEYCRQILASYRNGGVVLRADGAKTTVTSIGEMVGPQQIPELNPDARLVPITFEVATRRPRNTPDYERIRAELIA